jgi:hypothetical protein
MTPHDAARCFSVLVVDDDHDSADTLTVLLRTEGHDVRVA